MNFKLDFVQASIRFVLALFFILLGLVAAMIPWSSAVQMNLVRFILHDSLTLSFFGFAFIVIGLAIMTYGFINGKRRHYSIRSGSDAISVDVALIQQYLDVYWKELFPQNDIPSHVTLKNHKIHITVDFPSVPVKQQPLILERAKKDLKDKFSDLLGYHSEFYLSASFPSS